MNAQFYLILSAIIVVITSVISLVVALRIYNEFYNKTLKLDITLEDMKRMESNISVFRKEHQIGNNARIKDIAQILKVHDGGENDSLTSQAELNYDNGEMRVIYRTGLKPYEKTFNLAHECAHIINKDPIPVTRPTGHNKPHIEQLADYTAAALLMPLNEVYDYLSVHKYKEASAKRRMKLIQELCRKYEVSEVIALRRVTEVFELKCNC